MSRRLKCYGFCDEKYPKEELTLYKNKNYCPQCLVIKKDDDDGREKLINEITKIYNIPYPTGAMLRQMKDFRESRNYKYNDQAKAIWYGKHVLKKDFHSKYGLGLVPYIIEDAIIYFESNKKRAKKLENITSINKTQIIYKTSKSMIGQNYKDKKMINMEELFNE